ncbi:MAG TPA: hypothetical protein VH934_19490 [Xanthobacteraceae bacterium]|jgi:hypothetical protein
MNEARADFKRMLVRLPHSTHDYAGVGVAAELAALLGASLVATFVQDAELVDLAALPCVRELRPLGGGWHPIEGPQLLRQLDRAVATARRRFQEAVRSTQIEASFNVATGAVADVLGTTADDDDIIVIIEPRNPVERVTQQFTRFVDAAFGASVAVLLVPSRIARTAGPIAAVISGPEDPGLHFALAIAAAAKERVIALAPVYPNARAAIRGLAEAAGVRLEAGPTIHEPFDVAALLAQLGDLNERLLVMSRGAVGDRGVATIASRRGIPVLLARARDR